MLLTPFAPEEQRSAQRLKVKTGPQSRVRQSCPSVSGRAAITRTVKGQKLPPNSPIPAFIRVFRHRSLRPVIGYRQLWRNEFLGERCEFNVAIMRFRTMNRTKKPECVLWDI